MLFEFISAVLTLASVGVIIGLVVYFFLESLRDTGDDK